jgi:hypothetical protein
MAITAARLQGCLILGRRDVVKARVIDQKVPPGIDDQSAAQPMAEEDLTTMPACRGLDDDPMAELDFLIDGRVLFEFFGIVVYVHLVDSVFIFKDADLSRSAAGIIC